MPFEVWLNSSGAPFAPDITGALFRDRPHYDVERGWSLYRHPDTGVEFSVIWAPPSSVSPEPWSDGRRMMFRVNHLRPDFFGLEMVSELFAVLPSLPGRPVVERGRTALESEWRATNREAIRAAEAMGHSFPRLPSVRLHDIWQWNRSREKRQRNQGSSVFVPKISLLERSGSVASTAIWTDGDPVLLPPVDIVTIVRARLPPAGLAFLPWQELQAAATRVQPFDDSGALLVSAAVPGLRRAVLAATAPVPPWRGLPFTDVLDT